MEESGKCRGCFGWILVLIVLGAIAFAIWMVIHEKYQSSDKDSAAPVPGSPGAIIKKYSDALKVALQFFDVQKSGKLEDNKIDWRGDSALNDGKDAKVDLSKGMYDAGDHMKFGFPMAFTATILSWSILEYGDQMQAVGQLESAQKSLRWITDYLVNAHASDDMLYVQVGDPTADHKCWNRPEDMTEKRPLLQVNTSAPGSDVAAETAAAMASASLVFKSGDSTYSSSLLKHAQQLFNFADKNRGAYSKSIPDVQTFYNSTDYGDELLWAAGWLYHATKNPAYMKYVTGKNGLSFAKWGKPTWFSWDDKLPGVHVLLSRVGFFGSKDDSSFFGLKHDSNSDSVQKYRETAEAIMCNILPKSPKASDSRTDSGLIWVSEWNSLQQPMASALLTVIFSDYMLSSRTAKITCDGDSFSPLDLRQFAMSQADYVLGNNPMKMSYLVGYGDKFPKYVHHRGASIPANQKPTCSNGWKWLDSKEPNPNIAVGALVGGPFLNETYIDSRNNSMQGEPSTYNSALLIGLFSGLVTTSSVVQSFT